MGRECQEEREGGAMKNVCVIPKCRVARMHAFARSTLHSLAR